MSKRIFFTAAAILLAAAVFFKIFMAGYAFLAMVLCAFAAAAVLLAVLPERARKALCILMALWFIVFLSAEICVIEDSYGRNYAEADYLIVLGARVNGTLPSKSLKYRLDAAKEYLDDHPDCIAVLSGGQGSDEAISEAECMYRWLLNTGIDSARLIKEDRSTNTAENLAYSAQKIREHSGSDDLEQLSIVVCSGEYHLCRARLLSQKTVGIDPGTLPAPTMRPVLKITYFIREACGLLVQDLYL